MLGERLAGSPPQGVNNYGSILLATFLRHPVDYLFRNFFNGITLGGIFYATGGSTESEGTKTDILAWDAFSEEWIDTGAMQSSRSRHAVTVVSFDDFQQYCN